MKIIFFLACPCKNLDYTYRHYIIMSFIKIILGVWGKLLRIYKDNKRYFAEAYQKAHEYSRNNYSLASFIDRKYDFRNEVKYLFMKISLIPNSFPVSNGITGLLITFIFIGFRFVFSGQTFFESRLFGENGVDLIVEVFYHYFGF